MNISKEFESLWEIEGHDEDYLDDLRNEKVKTDDLVRVMSKKFYTTGAEYGRIETLKPILNGKGSIGEILNLLRSREIENPQAIIRLTVLANKIDTELKKLGE